VIPKLNRFTSIKRSQDMKHQETEHKEIESDLLEISSSEMFKGLESGGGLRSGAVSADGLSLELLFESGRIRLHPKRGGMVELEVECLAESPSLPFPSRNRNSWAVIEKPDALPVRLSEEADLFKARWEGGSVEVRKKDGSLCLQDGEERVIFHMPDGAFLFSPTLLALSFETGAEERFFGLGEKSGTMNRRGRLFEMWNSDEPRHNPERDPLYVSIPLLHRHDGTRFTSLFLDEEGRSWFDLADRTPDRFTVAVPLARMHLYLWSGGNIREAFAPYAGLTGRAPLPPLWSLGYHQSRYSYFTDTEVRSIAREFRSRSIPCDVIHLDIDYMDEYRVFTWDKKAFPDPEKLTRELRAEGFRTVTIIDPGVGTDKTYRVYEEGRKNGHFLTDMDGGIYIGAVWPGKAAYPDFLRQQTRDWWAKEVSAHIGRGVSGIWNDMNEPADFTGDPYHRRKFTVPDTVRCVPDDTGNGEGGTVPFLQMHNLYGQGMCMATREGIRSAKPQERPFVLSRAGYAGIQRYAALWTGDNSSWWEHMAMSIPMLLGLGISGVPFVGADAGGFQSNADGELFARWIAYAAFTPFFRGHSAIKTRPHEPWAFGPEVERAARKAIETRYRYLPYTYSLFHEASETGAPPMRPLFWEFPDDDACYEVNDQYLFGPDILVAPVCTPGRKARAVYLPRGEWEDLNSGDRHSGGRYILADAPLDRLPLFVRVGAIIPRTEVVQSTGDAFWNPLELHIYLPEKGEVFGEHAFTVFEDDGISPDELYPFRSRRKAVLKGSGLGSCRFAFEGARVMEQESAPRILELHLHRAGGRETEVIKVSDASSGTDLELSL
jgi:alpha-glucosidase